MCIDKEKGLLAENKRKHLQFANWQILIMFKDMSSNMCVNEQIRPYNGTVNTLQWLYLACVWYALDTYWNIILNHKQCSTGGIQRPRIAKWTTRTIDFATPSCTKWSRRSEKNKITLLSARRNPTDNQHLIWLSIYTGTVHCYALTKQTCTVFQDCLLHASGDLHYARFVVWSLCNVHYIDCRKQNVLRSIE